MDSSKKVIVSCEKLPVLDSEFAVADRRWISEIGRLASYYGEDEVRHFAWVVAVCVGKAVAGLPDEAFVDVDGDPASVSHLRIGIPSIGLAFPVRYGPWWGTVFDEVAYGRGATASEAVRVGVAKAMRHVADYENHPFSARRPPSPAQFGYIRSIVKATNIVVPISARIDVAGASEFITAHAETAREYGARPGDAGRS